MNTTRPIQRTESGFTLVETMIGMVIGLIGMIVVMQVAIVFQSSKTNTSNGSKAQNAAAISLYSMERDIEQGGYGLNTMPIIGCQLQLKATVSLPMMAPALVNPAFIPAGDLNTDTVLVAYSNSIAQTEGDPITAHTATNTYTVAAPLTFNVGDSVIAQLPSRATPCNLVLDSITGITGSDLTVTTGTPAYVPSGGYGPMFNLGSIANIKIRAYAVRGGVLTQCDLMAATGPANDCTNNGNTGNPAVWVPIGDNIVSLRAQYGRDTTVPMDGIVDVYDQTAPVTACDLARISAVRLAVVARNSQYQKGIVTTTNLDVAAAPGSLANAPTWTGNATSPIVGATGYMGPNQAIDEPWKHYRYKVFETLVPMRNISWMGAVTGC